MKVKMGRYTKRKGRRVDVEIDPSDVYSMDHTLAYIILPMLILLRDRKHGVPHEFAVVGGEDYCDQQSFDFYTETNAECFELGSKRWDDVLDKMIWSFQQLVEDQHDSLYHRGDLGKMIFQTTTDPGVSSMTFSNPNGGFYDKEGHELHMEKIQEGLDLFARHYLSLWD